MKLVMHFHQSSNIFGINRESLLLQVGSSSQGGGDIGLDGGDSGPHLALLNEGGGGLLVEGGNGVGDDGDLSLWQSCQLPGRWPCPSASGSLRWRPRSWPWRRR